MKIQFSLCLSDACSSQGFGLSVTLCWLGSNGAKTSWRSSCPASILADPEDNEKLVSEVIMDSIQDVYDIIDEEGQRIHIYHMSIDDAMVQLLEKCDVMCQADELKVYFEIFNY